ncbi:phage tail tape measure protein [Liquorilactobacillus hordei]|uniref:phage tail tape measure protein n=1 Tax=Liquorilactobacillus hordei TaxID=468911 RepID=UPI0039E9FF97
MAQQLGIKVKVNLPSKSQLESEFREKWRDFKADFTAKINVEADRNSLKKMGTQIKAILDGTNVIIKPKLDTSSVSKELLRITKEFRHLREEMEKNIDVKINMNDVKSNATSNIAENFKKQSHEIEQTGKEVGKRITENTLKEEKALQGSLSKLVTASKQTSNGVSRSVTKSEDINAFTSRVTKSTSDGGTTKLILDQKKALNELKQTMKEIGSLETKVAGSNDQGKISAWSGRIKDLNVKLKELQTTYQRTFSKLNGGDNSAFTGMKSGVDSVKKMNIALAETQLKAKESANVFKQLSSVENAKNTLQTRGLTANREENLIIQKQLSLLESKKRLIVESNGAEKLLSSTQKQELAALQNENKLRLMYAQAQAKAARPSLTKSLAQPLKLDTGSLVNGATTATLAVGGLGAVLVDGAKKASSLQNTYKVTSNLLVNGGEKVSEVTKNVAQMQKDGQAYSVKYGKSQSDIALQYQELIKRGYSSASALGAMKSELQGSVASGDAFSDVVKVSSQTLDAFNLRTNNTAKMTKNTKKVVNELAYAADMSATSFAGIGKGMEYVGDTAHNSGISLAESAAALGELANHGLEADKAGTGLRKVIVSLGKDIAKIGTKGDVLTPLGIKKSDLVDAKGNFKSLGTMMDVIKQKTQGMGKAQKSNVFNALFGTTGQQAGIILSQYNKQFQDLAKHVQEVGDKGQYVQKLADSNNKTAQQSVARFKEAWNNLKIMFGAKLLPTMTDAADDLSKLFNSKSFVAGIQQDAKGFGNMAKELYNLGKYAAENSDKFEALGKILLDIWAINKVVQYGSAMKSFFSLLSVGRSKIVAETEAVSAEAKAYTNLAAQKELANSADIGGGTVSKTASKAKSASKLESAGEAAESIGMVGTLEKTVGSVARVTGKFSSLLGVAKVLGGGLLRLVPIVGTVFAAFQIMDALGIRPWEINIKGADLTKDAIDNLNSSLAKNKKAFNETEKSIESNPVFNGRAVSNVKTYSQLNDNFNKGTNNDKHQLSDNDFTNLQNNYNSLAKKNHLKLRITINDYDSIKEQLSSLNAQLDDLAQKSIKKGNKKIDNEIDSAGKLGSGSTFNKLMGTDKDYASQKNELNSLIDSQNRAIAGGQTSYNAGQKKIKEYQAQLKLLDQSYNNGAKNAQIWSSKYGKAVEEQWNNQTKSVRKHINEFGKALNSNVYSKSDISIMSDSTLNKAGVAQGTSLEKLTKQKSMIDSINQKLATGGELNQKEIEYLAKQNSSLGTKSNNTAQWSSTEKKAAQDVVDGYNKVYDTEKTTQENRMRDILSASGKSQASINSTIAAYEKGGASYINLMSKQGTLGKSMLNLSVEFASQYGKNWGNAYAKIQKQVDKVPKTAMTEYSFVDKTTGLVDTHVIAKLNEIPEKKGTKYGLTYDDQGHVKIPSIIKALNGIPEIKGTKYDINGTVDAQSLITDLTTNIKAVPPVIALKFLAQTTGFKSGFKEIIKSMALADGKKATAKFLADNHYFGLSADEVNKYLKGIDGKTATAKIKADIKGYSKDVDGVDKTTQGISDKISKKPIKVKGDAKDALSKIEAAQKKLSGIKNKTANIKGNHKDLDSKISSSQKNLAKLKNKIVKALAKVGGDSDVKKLSKGINGIKGKTAKVVGKPYGAKDIKSLGSAISKTKGKSVSVKSKVSGKGSVDNLRHSIDKTHSKNTKTTNKTFGKKQVEDLISSISNVHGKTSKIQANVHGKKDVDSLTNSINNLPTTKSVTISVDKTETTTKKTKKSNSVAISASAVTSASPSKSLSAAIGSDNAALAKTAANSVATKDFSDSTDDTNNSTVSEDVWRYWGQQLYTGDSLSSQITKLENAVTQASDDMDKLIGLSQQRLILDDQQINYQNGLKNSYQNQMNSLLSQLRGYGFNNNGNQITNLDHSQSFRGDDADKVTTLLDSYKTVYENLIDVSNTINSLDLDKWQQQQNIIDYNTTKETNNVATLTAAATSLTNLLSNNASIFSRALDEVSDTDYSLKSKLSSESISDQVSSMQQLISQFNKLSTMSFISKDNATSVQSSLESIKSALLSDADAIITLRKTINDTQINQISTDLTNFTTSLNTNINRLKTNVTDLQDGLLSGQSFDDLGSSSLNVIDFNQSTGLSSEIQQRLQLESELDQALDGFAKKNVDRTQDVANTQLQIEQDKYSQLVNLANAYQKGQVGNISLNSNISDSLDLSDTVSSTNENLEKQFATISQKFADKLNLLKSQYANAIGSSSSQSDKDAATQKFIVQQLELQEDIYKEMITSDEQSIVALKEKLNLQGLTTDQINTIKTDISSYEEAIIEAQTNIKAAIKDRFDYENTLIQSQITKYQNVTDTISNMVSLAKTLGLDTNAQGALMAKQYQATFNQYTNYLSQLNNLKSKQSTYDNGSYEYNSLQTEIDTLLSGLQTTVSSLAELNKTQLTNSLTGITQELEKSVYNGQTSDQYSLDNSIYYQGVSKELELESLRLKANDLENNVVEKRLEALDAQTKMSKIEADYVDKQIDLAAAQEKLTNAQNQKNVQVLTSDGNGGFNWQYEANQTDVKSAEKDYNSAAASVQEYKEQQKQDYLSKVEAVISGIEDGSIKQDDAKNRLSSINDAYKDLLDDIPTFDPTKLDDINDEYNNYVSKNKTLLDKYGSSSDISGTTSYQELLSGFGEQFKSISKDLGDIFGKEIRDALNLPTTSGDVTNNSTNKSVTIDNLTLELPNVSDAESFVEALKTLPDIARQAATSK